ncbi:MAG TPA: LysR substrate-binding domain-containing protein [Solirubrobacteraceae bacterium]|nr:LysR substrate-binding domain-containing protein [Solirubrobacteraceae bacterium]
MLDPRLLTSFREVAVRRSFSAAADALGFTQPAISQHVSRLERTLGTRLLERDARGVRPTMAGEALLRGADAVLEQLRRLEADVREAAGQARPALRVAAFPTAAAGLLPGALAELRVQQPDVQVDLHILEPDPAVERLAAGGLDVAMVIESELDPVQRRDGLDYLPVMEDPMLVALPAGHHLAARAALSLDDLAGEPWLLTEVGGTCADSNIVLRACRDAGFSPQIRFESEDYNALQGMAAAGLGIAMIPSLAGVTVRPDVMLRPVRGRGPVRQILAAVRAHDRDPLVDCFVDGLRAASGALPSAVPRLAVVA